MDPPNDRISSPVSQQIQIIDKSPQIILLWLVLRVLTSLRAALLSPQRPITDIEKAIPLWPPSFPIPVWLERTLLAPWERYDAVWFKRIVTLGYLADDGTAQFHPLYPLLATPPTRLGIHPMLSMLLVSSLFSVLLIIFFERLAQLDLRTEQAHTSTLLLVSFPVSFILFAPYTEALPVLRGAVPFLGKARAMVAGWDRRSIGSADPPTRGLS